MKWVTKIALILLTALSLSCAQGELADTEGSQSDGDAAGADVLLDDTGPTRDAPGPADSDASASPDAPPSDTGFSDAAPSDAQPNDTDAGDAGPDGAGEDVDTGGGCVQNGCTDGICDSATGACVECVSDGDCTDGRCHNRHQICVPDCCTETAEPAFTSDSYSHNRFDIDVTGAGEPSILFGDGETDTLRYAQQVGSQWLSQDITSADVGTSTNIRLTLAAGGDPHVILGRYETLKHFWRDQNGWQEHDLLVDPGSVGYVDIAADSQGTIHMIALLGYGDEILYATYDAQGQRSEEYLTLPPANRPVWVNVATTSDGRPIASFQIGQDKDVVVAERSSAGSWSYEIPGDDVAQVHGMAVGPDDQPVIAYHRETTDGLRLLRRQASQSWTDDLIVASPDHGFTPDVAVDSLGDPHVVYMARGPGQNENPLYYARWDGADWEHLQVTGADRAFYPRIALDDSRTPHIAVYDPPNDTITYVRLD